MDAVRNPEEGDSISSDAGIRQLGLVGWVWILLGWTDLLLGRCLIVHMYSTVFVVPTIVGGIRNQDTSYVASGPSSLKTQQR